MLTPAGGPRGGWPSHSAARSCSARGREFQYAGGLRSPAHVPGAEQKLFHLELVRGRGEIVPRLNEWVPQHGVLHQPEAERQHEFAAEAAGKLAVHDDDAPARTQVFPCMAQYRAVMWHRIVTKAEEDAVERFTRDVLAGVALGQMDVSPVFASAKCSRPAQHSS